MGLTPNLSAGRNVRVGGNKNTLAYFRREVKRGEKSFVKLSVDVSSFSSL